ncbi:DnaA regulatory inactivator Hda [Thalassotalea profundi]|uniref:DnaA regulatory inactivator Hda n=1 Tax=Thalassotalea profundi TaxID=2036687 RepID=A0ABQ3J0Z6_9GAMM|nr:DnaA regulatory inactivator Hda [Thalassotalea profundi]GHE97924.1 DnaA regulatory inactivator Hda [Thalassotalea profundi]
MTKHTQLALQVQLPDDETFLSYRGENRKALIDMLSTYISPNEVESEHNVINGKAIPGCYLFGLSGAGKSHLLHASCSLAAELKLSSVCLSLGEVQQYSVDILDGLEHIDLVCLDDIQLISRSSVWQQAVFDLYNRIGEQNNKIIISGDKSIKALNLTLPDLASRLSWGYVEQVKLLNDEDKLQALQFRAGQRGLVLSHEVASFLVTRLSRDMKSLIQALDALDQASIREQRKITIPFIKNVLL